MIVNTLDLAEFLSLTGKGLIFQLSFPVNGGATADQGTNPPTVAGQSSNIYVKSIRFDGVQPGYVLYSLNIGGAQFSGYAPAGTLPIEVFCATPYFNFQIQNNQASACVVTMDLYAMNDEVNQEILMAVTKGEGFQLISGRQY